MGMFAAVEAHPPDTLLRPRAMRNPRLRGGNDGGGAETARRNRVLAIVSAALALACLVAVALLVSRRH